MKTMKSLIFAFLALVGFSCLAEDPPCTYRWRATAGGFVPPGATEQMEEGTVYLFDAGKCSESQVLELVRGRGSLEASSFVTNQELTDGLVLTSDVFSYGGEPTDVEWNAYMAVSVGSHLFFSDRISVFGLKPGMGTTDISFDDQTDNSANVFSAIQGFSSPGWYELENDLTVNGVSVLSGSGDGWTIADNVILLTNAQDYVISGTNAPSALRVAVTADAAVTLSNLCLTAMSSATNLIVFAGNATNATLTLVGENTLCAKRDLSAIEVTGGVTLTITGDGTLVGGKADGRCVLVAEGGELVLNSGTIRDYHTSTNGAGICCRGLFTMNGGAITGCRSATSGGAVCFEDGSDGGELSGGTIDGCEALDGAALANLSGGTVDVRDGLLVTGNCASNAVCFVRGDGAELSVWGGVFTNNVCASQALLTGRGDATVNVCGGVWTGNAGLLLLSDDASFTVWGGVFDSAPDADLIAFGSAAMEVGGLSVVGKCVTQKGAQLTGGTYTFCPTNAEYAAAGVTLQEGRRILPQTTNPVTWTISTGLTVDGRDLAWGAGEGWAYAGGVLSLTNEQAYALSGTNTEGAITIAVTAAADVTLEGFCLAAETPAKSLITFSDDATNVTLTLVGDNALYATNGLSALEIASGVTLTIDGDGALVGGKANGADGRCVLVAEGGTLVQNGGTIRDYYASTNGAGVCNCGEFTMNGGAITGCRSDGCGGGVCFEGDDGGALNGGTIGGCEARDGGAFADLSDGRVSVRSDMFVSGNLSTAGSGVCCVRKNTSEFLILGGTFANNTNAQSHALLAGYGNARVHVYGGVWTGNADACFLKDCSSFTVHGGVYDAAPDASLFPARKVTEPETEAVEVGGLFVVGQDVKEEYSQLTHGTYAFCPTNAEYVAAGVAVAAKSTIEVTGDNPERWRIEEKDEVGVTVDGLDLNWGHGDGWVFADGVLSLANAQAYVLAGTNTAGAVRVEVTANADVTLDNLQLLGTGTTNVVTFASGATKATLTLVGDNQIYATNAFAAVCVLTNAAVTLSGEGALVGGRSAAADGRCVLVATGGTFVMDGGTIRDYPAAIDNLSGGSVDVYGGVLTGNADSLLFKDCASSKVWGGVYDSAPDEKLIAFDSPAVPVGGLFVVGKGVTQYNGGLSSGTYTFCPTNAEYAAEGIGLAPNRQVEAKGGAPAIWTIELIERTGVAVGGRDVAWNTGDGWTFEDGVLTLTNAQEYVLSGTNTTGAVRVEVTADANVMLDNLQLLGTETTNVLTFASGATNVTLTLVGDNTVYATNDFAAVCVLSNATVTLSGEGSLVGGKADGAAGRCVLVSEGGTFVMEGGTIRDYLVDGKEGGGVYCAGKMAMADGIICNNEARGTTSRTGNGGAITVVGGTLELLGGAIRTNGASRYGGAFYAVGSTVKITGGTLAGNRAVHGGCMHIENGSVTMSGGVIMTNTLQDCKSNGIKLGNGGTFDATGGVFDGLPDENLIARGYEAKEVGGIYVVGQGVAQTDAQLTSGIFTFCPTNAEYVAAGLEIARCSQVVEKTEDPATWTVEEKTRLGISVDGKDLNWGFGDGWTFADGVISLTNAQSYVLTGTNTEGAVRVNVTAAAAVTIRELSLKTKDYNCISFSSGSSGAELILSGDNTVNSVNGHAAVLLHHNVTVTLTGDGLLTGDMSVNGCGVNINAGSALVMNGGIIRYFNYNGNGAGIVDSGSFTMNGGVISSCKCSGSSRYGAGLAVTGGSADLNAGTIEYCHVDWGSAFAVISSGRANVRSGMVFNGNYAATYVMFCQNGTINFYGGTFRNHDSKNGALFVPYNDCAVNMYGGVCVGNSCKLKGGWGALNVSGGVFDKMPSDYITLAGGAAVSRVGAFYVVGRDVGTNDVAQLVAGTYTFCPTNAEYVAAGLAVADGVPVTQRAGTPVTWTLGLVYPDYLLPWGSAVTNTFDNWAERYGSRDPDGVYTNAFLLNVATNRESAAVAAFGIESLVVTNDIADITVAEPIDDAPMYNGKVWLQCATNDLSEADWLDIEDGRYTEGEKSFFRLRIDFEHKVTPEAFPKASEGGRTMRVIVR